MFLVLGRGCGSYLAEAVVVRKLCLSPLVVVFSTYRALFAKDAWTFPWGPVVFFLRLFWSYAVRYLVFHEVLFIYSGRFGLFCFSVSSVSYGVGLLVGPFWEFLEGRCYVEVLYLDGLGVGFFG